MEEREEEELGLFDRMKEVITVDISEKISYGTSIRKLAGEIKTNESEIGRLINQTGRRCVEKHLHETDTEYEDLFAEIRSLQDKNRSLSTQIQELKVQQAEEEQKRRQAREEMQLARQQEKASLKEQQPPLEETGKICTQCGKSNDVDAVFCVYCGTAFSTETEEDKADTEVEENRDVL